MTSNGKIVTDQEHLDGFDALFSSGNADYDRVRDLMPHFRRLFLALPYTSGNTSSHHSFEDVVFFKNRFTAELREWENRIFAHDGKSGTEPKIGTIIRWDQFFIYMEALCEGLTSGDIVVDTFHDLSVLGTLFHKLYYLYEEPEAVQYFVRTGNLLDVLEYLVVFAHEHVGTSVVLDGFEALYTYETTLKRVSEIDGTEDYANFVDMPMEIKASLSHAFYLAMEKMEEERQR